MEVRRLVVSFPPRRAGFMPRSGDMGFVVDKAAMGQTWPEYFGFPCQWFHRVLHSHYHLSSMAGTIGQIAADVTEWAQFRPAPRNSKRNTTAGYIGQQRSEESVCWWEIRGEVVPVKQTCCWKYTHAGVPLWHNSELLTFNIWFDI